MPPCLRWLRRVKVATTEAIICWVATCLQRSSPTRHQRRVTRWRHSKQRARLPTQCAKLTKPVTLSFLTLRSKLAAKCRNLISSCSRFETRKNQLRKLLRHLTCFCVWKGPNLPRDWRKSRRRADCQLLWWLLVREATEEWSLLARCKIRDRSPQLTLWTLQRIRHKGHAPLTLSQATDRPLCRLWTRSSPACSKRLTRGRMPWTRMKIE